MFMLNLSPISRKLTPETFCYVVSTFVYLTHKILFVSQNSQLLTCEAKEILPHVIRMLPHQNACFGRVIHNYKELITRQRFKKNIDKEYYFYEFVHGRFGTWGHHYG